MAEQMTEKRDVSGLPLWETEAASYRRTHSLRAYASELHGRILALGDKVRRLQEIIDGPQLAPPLVIEDQGGRSTEWVVSFAGLHPTDRECITLHDGPTAFKLASLVRRLVASRERSLGEIIRQHEERGGDE